MAGYVDQVKQAIYESLPQFSRDLTQLIAQFAISNDCAAEIKATIPYYNNDNQMLRRRFGSSLFLRLVNVPAEAIQAAKDSKESSWIRMLAVSPRAVDEIVAWQVGGWTELRESMPKRDAKKERAYRARRRAFRKREREEQQHMETRSETRTKRQKLLHLVKTQ